MEGAFFFHEFLRVLQFRLFLAHHLHWDRRNHDYSLSQMILALVWPVMLRLDRIETASLLRANGTFQLLVGLPSFPDPRTLRRFLLRVPTSFAPQPGRVSDRLLQLFMHLPHRRSRLILALDLYAKLIEALHVAKQVHCCSKHRDLAPHRRYPET